MGNFSDLYYFYRTVSCIIASIFILLLLVIIVLEGIEIDSQQKQIYRLKREKIDVESDLEAIKMIRKEKVRNEYWFMKHDLGSR